MTWLVLFCVTWRKKYRGFIWQTIVTSTEAERTNERTIEEKWEGKKEEKIASKLNNRRWIHKWYLSQCFSYGQAFKLLSMLETLNVIFLKKKETIRFKVFYFSWFLRWYKSNVIYQFVAVCRLAEKKTRSYFWTWERIFKWFFKVFHVLRSLDAFQ